MTDTVEELQTLLGDRYIVEREIGRGGMATVYLARDTKHDRQVAVKLLRPEIGALLGAGRFLHEIKLTSRLQHPHILPLYDSGEADNRIYYVMPFVDGESLRERLRREKRLPVDAALAIVREVADALAYAHARGVVHRDIKPENILLSQNHALVSDFGIARAISRSGGEKWETLTSSGVVVGTPAYMSPEQAAGDMQIDGRSDIYSLGCVLFEMLVGVPPFTGPDGELKLVRRFTERAPSVRDSRQTVSERLDGAIAKALELDPVDRFTTAEEFIAAMFGPGGMIRRSSSGRAKRVQLLAPALILPYSIAAIATVVAVWLVVGKNRQPAVVSERAVAPVDTGVAASPRNPLATPPSPSVAPESVQRAPTPTPATAAQRGRDTATGARGAPTRRVVQPPVGTEPRVAERRVTSIDSAPRQVALDSAPVAPPPVMTPPPPVVPSTTVAAAPAVPEDARPAIAAVIADYARAIESAEIAAVRRVYPGLSPTQQRALEQFFQTVRQIQARLSITSLTQAGTTAEVTVSGTYDYILRVGGRRERRDVVFQATFDRVDRAWRMTTVR